MSSQNRFTGLTSLMVMENNRWKKSYEWLKVSLIWVLIINGLVLLAVSQYSLLGNSPTAALGLDVLFQLFSGAAPVGAIIMIHSSLISDKEKGITAWVLSAPVSRLAVIASKFVVNLAYSISIIVVLQSIIAQQVIQYLTGETINSMHYYMGVAQIALYITFWIAFTTMLGAMLNKRGTVIGAAMLTLFFHDLIANLVARILPFFPKLMPSTLLNSAITTVSGGAPSIQAILVVLAWITLFILVAGFSFEREEF